MNNPKSFLRSRLNPTVYSALSKTKQALWHSGNTSQPEQTDLGKLAEIGEPFSTVLRSMYSGQPKQTGSGTGKNTNCVWILESRSKRAHVSIVFAATLKRNAPWRLAALTVSALSIFWPPSAPILPPHTPRSIQYESNGWQGIAVQNARAVGMDTSFRLIEEKSFLAVPRMISDGTQYDLIFIDANHRFDDTLVEFTLCALACKMGGYILLDDMWMPSIRKAVSFVRRNRRDLSEVAMPVLNLAAFQKVAEDKREMGSLRGFSMTLRCTWPMNRTAPQPNRWQKRATFQSLKTPIGAWCKE